MIAFGDIFGLGGSSVISRLLGEKKDKEAKKTCAFYIWISIVFGISISVLLLLFRTQILEILGVSKETYPYANDYYTWIVIGAFAVIFSMVPSNILRTEGLAVQSMAGSIIGSVVNIIFDTIFIFGFHQGAAGAAMATVFGNIIADIYYVYAIIKKSKRLSCSPSDMKVTGRRIQDILFSASISCVNPFTLRSCFIFSPIVIQCTPHSFFLNIVYYCASRSIICAL
ncbi:MATE family efflux transporter [Anaerostipes sp.]|uniref:MATE family efflux transporter n=1 Tax=Anaerostipes sp. TaxID=1872530 RepID=UPI003FEEEDFD